MTMNDQLDTRFLEIGTWVSFKDLDDNKRYGWIHYLEDDTMGVTGSGVHGQEYEFPIIEAQDWDLTFIRRCGHHGMGERSGHLVCAVCATILGLD